jgi:hypothetical protein
MRKFLGAILAVGAVTIVSSVAGAQLDHGSEHDMHGAKGHMMKAGHHEMMKNHMSNAEHGIMSQMSKAGHEMMKNHMGKTGHDKKNHAGKAGHE